MADSRKPLRLVVRKRFGIVLVLFIFSVSIPGFGKLRDSPDLNWWTVGSSGIKERFGENFYKIMDRLDAETRDHEKILYAIAETPLSKEQIIKKTGLTDGRVSSLISSLSSIRVIRTVGSDQWATTVPVVTDREMKQIRKSLSAMTEATAIYLKNEASDLRSRYTRARTSLDPPWEDVAHLFLCKMIVDASFHRNMNILNRERKKRKSEGATRGGVSLFFSELGPNYTSLGCNWYDYKNKKKHRVKR